MKRRLSLPVVFVLLAGVLSVPVASAAVPACLISNERTGLGSRSLQQGIDAAAPGDKLVVKGTCIGISAITKDLTLKGVSNPAFGDATLDGGDLGSVITIANGVAVAISHVAITNGTGTEGGGIYNNSTGAVTLSDSTVSGNTATSVGGGIYNSPGGAVTLRES